MNEPKNINSPKNNNNFNNIKLSKGAISFLDNQIIKNGENKIIEINFTFQIINAIKKLSNWYCCSLMDQDSKFGGFCIKYEDQYGEPKQGDIIQTEKIQIIKLPNRDSNLYFCENVKKINESKKMIIDPKKIDSISKKRSNSKKESLEKNNNDQKSSSNHLNLSYKNNIKKESKDKNKIYTFVSELTSFTNNPILFLKCKFKSVLKIITSLDKGFEGEVQNYIFYDTKGDEIQAVAFRECANKLNNIIKIGSIYEISKVGKQKIKPNFKLSKCQIQLIFKNNSVIEEIEDKGEFDNAKNENKSEFIELKNLTKTKIDSNVNVIGIILEDKGIIEKRKENEKTVKLRILSIGDNNLNKINVKLWEEKAEPNKIYSKGDVIYLYYFKYKKYYNIYDLNSMAISQILPCDDKEKEKELKEFYKKHQNINEYKAINYLALNSQDNINFKFIKNLIENYSLEFNENNNIKLIKITGTVINIYLSESNYYEGCIFCNKKFIEVCPTCLTDEKKSIFAFYVQIFDCSENIWIEFYGDIAEHFLGINVEDYKKLIKNNNEKNLEEIKQRILYNNYSFIGKYKIPSYFENNVVIFSVIQFCKNDNNYFKELIAKLNRIKNNII